jgi:hypothetical protein
MTRRTFAAGILLAAGARAQNVTAQKRGRELVDECIQALGGQNFLNMQDRVEYGRAYSFYRERLSGLSIAHLYTRYANPPQPEPTSYYGIFEKQSFGKKQDSSVLFVPDGGYELTFRGVRPLPDDSIAKHRESVVTNFLYILRQRLNEPGITFEAGALEVVENERVQTIDVYDNAERKITVYLGVQNKLPVKQSYMRLDAVYKERVEEIMRFSKYHDAGGGVMWPLDFQRERDGEKVYQMFSEKVSIGNHFEAGMFDLPRDMQMLKKENF